MSVKVSRMSRNKLSKTFYVLIPLVLLLCSSGFSSALYRANEIDHEIQITTTTENDFDILSTTDDFRYVEESTLTDLIDEVLETTTNIDPSVDFTTTTETASQESIDFLTPSVSTSEEILTDAESTNKDPLVVALPNGKIRGRDNGNHYSFESIPYAESPIDDLRFESPVPYTRKWTSIFDATKPPALCMQWSQLPQGPDMLEGVEDCLTINVYVPKTRCTEGKSLKKEGLPVLAVLHGGAFMYGGVNFAGPDQFMERGCLIIVKFTYRLGPLGFISTGDSDLPGNYGLKDQLLALKWIKQNIINFGGNPNAIAALGFSAGAASVQLHMMRPEFAQLVNVAVSMSGSALNPWVITRNARSRALELAQSIGCEIYNSSSMLKECLKAKPAEDIVRSVQSFLVLGYNPFTTFGPVVEQPSESNAFITQSPEEILDSGSFAKIPWLVSYTAQDGGYNAAELLRKDAKGRELIETLNQNWFELAPDLLFYRHAMSTMEELDQYSMDLKERYLGDKEFSAETYHDLQLMYTDILFKNGISDSVRRHRLQNAAPIYAYVYSIPSDRNVGTLLANRTDVKFGAVHADDFMLMFYHEGIKKIIGQLTPTQQSVSQDLLEMLEGFVESNGERLSYGNCSFVDNVGKQDLQILSISQNGCQNKNVLVFP